MYNFLGQGLNLYHSSDNTGSLILWATREFLNILILKQFHYWSCIYFYNIWKVIHTNRSLGIVEQTWTTFDDSTLAHTVPNAYVTFFFFFSAATFVNLPWSLHDTAIKIFFILTEERNDASASGLQMEQRVMINTLKIKIAGVIQQWETIQVAIRV